MVAQYHPLAKDRRRNWTPDQDSLLLLHYGSMPLEQLAPLVDKTPSAVKARMARLRTGCAATNFIPFRSPTHPVTPEAMQRLLERDHYPETAAWETFDDFRVRLFYGERPLPELAALLGRTVGAIRARLTQLNWSLDKAIAFRLEVSRSALWLEALQALQAAPKQQRAAVAEAKRTQTRRVINDLIKVNHGSAHERLANLTGYIAKLQRDLENAE